MLRFSSYILFFEFNFGNIQTLHSGFSLVKLFIQPLQLDFVLLSIVDKIQIDALDLLQLFSQDVYDLVFVVQTVLEEFERRLLFVFYGRLGVKFGFETLAKKESK